MKDPKQELHEMIEALKEGQTVLDQAQLEHGYDQFREKVDMAKAKIKEKTDRPLLQKIFPYKVIITRT